MWVSRSYSPASYAYPSACGVSSHVPYWTPKPNGSDADSRHPQRAWIAGFGSALPASSPARRDARRRRSHRPALRARSPTRRTGSASPGRRAMYAGPSGLPAAGSTDGSVWARPRADPRPAARASARPRRTRGRHAIASPGSSRTARRCAAAGCARCRPARTRARPSGRQSAAKLGCCPVDLVAEREVSGQPPRQVGTDRLPGGAGAERRAVADVLEPGVAAGVGVVDLRQPPDVVVAADRSAAVAVADSDLVVERAAGVVPHLVEPVQPEAGLGSQVSIRLRRASADAPERRSAAPPRCSWWCAPA